MSTFPQLATHPGMNPAAVIKATVGASASSPNRSSASNGRTTASSKTTPPK